jgi:hypothetical protein
MCIPNTYIDPSEYPVNISLGFGPDICFQVSPFIPKDKQALRSFQKHEGDDTLHVKDSLPIALNCFSVELTAETLDDWLDEIVHSQSDLSEYASLMMERHRENLSAKILQAVVSWFLTNNSKVSIGNFFSPSHLCTHYNLFRHAEHCQVAIDQDTAVGISAKNHPQCIKTALNDHHSQSCPKGHAAPFITIGLPASVVVWC